MSGKVHYQKKRTKKIDVEITVPLKHLGYFWRTLEMQLIKCEINPNLILSGLSVITNSTGVKTFATTETKVYVPVVTLPMKDNIKLLEQLDSGFKRKIS